MFQLCVNGTERCFEGKVIISLSNYDKELCVINYEEFDVRVFCFGEVVDKFSGKIENGCIVLDTIQIFGNNIVEIENEEFYLLINKDIFKRKNQEFLFEIVKDFCFFVKRRKMFFKGFLD